MIPVNKYLPSRVNLPFLEAWENKAFSRDDDNCTHGFISDYYLAAQSFYPKCGKM